MAFLVLNVLSIHGNPTEGDSIITNFLEPCLIDKGKAYELVCFVKIRFVVNYSIFTSQIVDFIFW
jgi:hypothetical protein